MRQGRRSGGGKNRPNRNNESGANAGRNEPGRDANPRHGGRGQPGSQSGQPRQGPQGKQHGQGNKQPNKQHVKPGHQGNAKDGRKTATALPSLIESPIRMSGKGFPPVQEQHKLPPRRYGVVFFDTLAAAKNDLPRLQDLARGYDQLNIVIRADAAPEATMNDPELAAIGKVFAGAAWALIHDRRVAEGWYDESH